MFTGIVRERARVVSYENGRLVVDTGTQAALGDSVAIDGVCLTVVAGDAKTLEFDVVPETQAKVARFGDEVNVEPALRAGEPLGGHVVQGHVDGVASVASVEPEGEGRRVRFTVPDHLLAYCVEKGSVALAGVSLTIAALTDDGFEIALIPHTLQETTLGGLRPGDQVNVEVDVLAKYVERLARATIQRHGSDPD